MFFAMLMNTESFETHFYYIGPFESEKECEKVCFQQNEKMGYRGNIRFVPQELDGAVDVYL